MSKIDTLEWKEFILGELFDLINSKAYHGKDISETPDEDGLLYVTRSKFNNGINCRVEKKSDYIINPAGTISFGAENADFFYQEEEYITGNKMYYIDTRSINKYAALYFKSVLEATFTRNYSFSDGMIPDRIRDKIIKLPATDKGEPDWNYMEEYMKNVETSVRNSLEKLQSAKECKNKMDIVEWKEFRVGDYFKGIRGKSRKLQALTDGETPIIAAAGYNQGIAGFFDVPSEYENAITISCNGVGCGSAFYHNYPFAITGDAIVLQNLGEVPQDALLYLTAIINAHFTRIYSYGDKCSAGKAEAEMIKLPATDEGKPDWDYMEKYMKDIEEKTKEKFNNLI